jgi:hypothetical protein
VHDCSDENILPKGGCSVHPSVSSSREQQLLPTSGMISHCLEPDYNSNWQQPTEVKHYVLKMYNGFTHSNKIPSAKNIMDDCCI